MYFTALIGNPVEHSVSHVLMERLAAAGGIKAPYKHIKVPVESGNDLSDVFAAFEKLTFKGVNVTLPYKLSVKAHVDDIDTDALAVGAVNTIAFRGGKRYATNTDWYGIDESVRRFAPDLNPRAVVIFGSGGAARAAIHAAKSLGADSIAVLHRGTSDEDAAQSLPNTLQEAVTLATYDSVAKHVAEADLVINATSAGMIGMDKTPFELALLDDLDVSQKVFFDVVFNPVDTPLLHYFDARGAQTIDGLWMMIFQAVKAIEFWTEESIDVSQDSLEVIHEELLEHTA